MTWLQRLVKRGTIGITPRSMRQLDRQLPNPDAAYPMSTSAPEALVLPEPGLLL
jgi:hypothetical protein